MSNCPKCGRAMVRGKVDGVDSMACLSCHHVMAPEAHESHGEPRVRHNTCSETLRESDVQADIVDALKSRGYIVHTTSRQRRGVMIGGKWRYSPRGDGCSPGLADLAIRHPTWPRAMWIHIEVKRPGGAASDAQWRLAQDGHILIVSSTEETIGWLARTAGVDSTDKA